jgi:hypothetical protein
MKPPPGREALGAADLEYRIGDHEPDCVATKFYTRTP